MQNYAGNAPAGYPLEPTLAHHSPCPTLSCSTNMSALSSLGGLLRALNDGLPQAYWFDVLEPNYEGLKHEKLMTLQQFSGLNSKNFEALLSTCRLVVGKSFTKRWQQFLFNHGVSDYELERKSVLGSRRWFLWLGPKNKGTFSDASVQFKCESTETFNRTR